MFDLSNWRDQFTQRELDEIYFNLLYKQQFNHGTDGHNMRIIVAKFAEYLETLQSQAKERGAE